MAGSSKELVGAEGVPSETQLVFDGVERCDPSVALEYPIPRVEVIVQALAESPTIGESQGPVRVDRLNRAVDVGSGKVEVGP